MITIADQGIGITKGETQIAETAAPSTPFRPTIQYLAFKQKGPLFLLSSPGLTFSTTPNNCSQRQRAMERIKMFSGMQSMRLALGLD
jgi:hypothetical protein